MKPSHDHDIPSMDMRIPSGSSSRSGNFSARRELPPGLIFDIARQAGIEIQSERDKVVLRCPFHPDGNASAFVSASNVFYCSVCTPDRGWSAKKFAEVLGVAWAGGSINAQFSCTPIALRRTAKPATRPLTFKGDDALAVWEAARRRALDEVHTEADRDASHFLKRRRLERAWRPGLVGFVGPETSLCLGSSSWYSLGVRLIAPLHDVHGELINVQGRNVLEREPRLLFPTGSQARGTMFANRLGLAALRGTRAIAGSVLVAEGLTDFLALGSIERLAVLSAPGAGMAAHAIGAWARGADVLLALDHDDAGHRGRAAAHARALACGARRVRWIEWPNGCADACEVLEQLDVEGLDLFFANQVSEALHA